MLPILSRKLVPPLTCSNFPMRRRSAPVKAPLADHAVQFLQIKGFEQVIVSALLHRFDGRLGRSDYGDKYNGDARVDLAELLQEIQAGLVGQAEVEENQENSPAGLGLALSAHEAMEVKSDALPTDREPRHRREHA